MEILHDLMQPGLYRMWLGLCIKSKEWEQIEVGVREMLYDALKEKNFGHVFLLLGMIWLDQNRKNANENLPT